MTFLILVFLTKYYLTLDNVQDVVYLVHILYSGIQNEQTCYLAFLEIKSRFKIV
jgi:hypothetical protein